MLHTLSKLFPFGSSRAAGGCPESSGTYNPAMHLQRSQRLCLVGLLVAIALAASLLSSSADARRRSGAQESRPEQAQAPRALMPQERRAGAYVLKGDTAKRELAPAGG
jgi:hypothetical protein